MADAKLENTELDEALLTQADLRGADLRNAKLAGAAFNGANLQGADLRGALGLSAMQVCSAAERDQVQLDEALQHDVQRKPPAARLRTKTSKELSRLFFCTQLSFLVIQLRERFRN